MSSAKYSMFQFSHFTEAVALDSMLLHTNYQLHWRHNHLDTVYTSCLTPWSQWEQNRLDCTWLDSCQKPVKIIPPSLSENGHTYSYYVWPCLNDKVKRKQNTSFFNHPVGQNKKGESASFCFFIDCVAFIKLCTPLQWQNDKINCLDIQIHISMAPLRAKWNER
jgi:hypothetical protein